LRPLEAPLVLRLALFGLPELLLRSKPVLLILAHLIWVSAALD
jgi:hypothetical protein